MSSADFDHLVKALQEHSDLLEEFRTLQGVNLADGGTSGPDRGPSLPRRLHAELMRILTGSRPSQMLL
jgi:hypothetical protein